MAESETGAGPTDAPDVVLEHDEQEYPERWEADVVLRDGSTAHLRPIMPEDADGIRYFHSQLSEKTIYFRFFAPCPELTDKDVERFTVVDHTARVALVPPLQVKSSGSVDTTKWVTLLPKWRSR